MSYCYRFIHSRRDDCFRFTCWVYQFWNIYIYTDKSLFHSFFPCPCYATYFTVIVWTYTQLSTVDWVWYPHPAEPWFKAAYSGLLPLKQQQKKSDQSYSHYQQKQNSSFKSYWQESRRKKRNTQVHKLCFLGTFIHATPLGFMGHKVTKKQGVNLPTTTCLPDSPCHIDLGSLLRH